MKPNQVTPQIILYLLVILVVFGCSSDSTTTENVKKTIPLLTGTWQQTAIGEKEVSDVVVKIIFAKHTLTMDAPGCLIIGDYTTADDILTFTITSAQGERCAPDQKLGKSDSVHYAVTDSQLILTPRLAGKESQLEYKRISTD